LISGREERSSDGRDDDRRDDPDPEERERIAPEGIAPGVRLDAERPDFVDVCSWHQQHAEMVIAAAARRPRAIICQKPMALSLGDAERMLIACRRNDVKLVIAYQHRVFGVGLRMLGSRAVIRLPDRKAASTTTTPSDSPAMIRLRRGKWRAWGAVPRGASATTVPPATISTASSQTGRCQVARLPCSEVVRVSVWPGSLPRRGSSP